MQQAKLPTKCDDERTTDDRKSKATVLTIYLSWLLNAPIKVAKVFLPAAGVVLAGPMTTLLSLGRFTPLISVFVTSFVSFQLKHITHGGAVAFLHAGGPQGFEGQALSLLNFITLNATFSSSGPPLQVLYDEMLLRIGDVQSAQSYAVSCGLKWSLDTFNRTWNLFVKSLRKLQCSALHTNMSRKEDHRPRDRDTAGSKWRRLSDAAKRIVSDLRPKQEECGDPAEKTLIDWDVMEAGVEVEAEAVEAASASADGDGERAQALFEELDLLIDSCDGLSGADWDSILAVFEDVQDGFELVESESESEERGVVASPED
ncbi:hypothetical protein EJ02DRAFT_465232 [Clathrospora elynae]|uniref:Uncharacterized protein n=1 Tax=Clathrospora elynae TaxID=706981 RepID=A0A6A5SR60_9PLEO|nr:hypothetical protein EJ02DRAFT_465232 [Clathrospora elynae]